MSITGDEENGVIVHLDHHCIGSTLLTNFYRTSKFKLNSNIIVNDNIFLSNEIIYHTKHDSKLIPSPQLLYRGSRDGFKAKDFHSRCDNQGPTLTIIKSSEPYNQIFGGFTAQSWNSSANGSWSTDSSAFVFKIDETNQFRKLNIKQEKKEFATLSNQHFLTIFGGSITILSDCNLSDKSSSYFGPIYELPNNGEDGYQPGSEKANRYLAGSFKFIVSEIEVFNIIR